MTVTDGTIRVLVIDDHTILAQSLVRLLDGDASISVIGTEGTAAAGIARALVERPDVVVMDYQLPDLDGATATRMLLAEDGGARVIILTGTELPGAYRAAMSAGCAAWVRKTSALQDLVDAVHRVHRGDTVPSHELDGLPPLEQIAVRYQPIVDLSTRDVVAFEALARWRHPDRGVLAPSEFIPAAESTGLIVDIDRLVMGAAIAQLAEWQRLQPRGARRWISVNLSASTMSDGVATSLRDGLRRTGVDPADVAVEITETMLLDESPDTVARLAELKGVGVHITLDDFGTAFSSLSYLRQWPVDRIKIDTSFTAQLPESRRTVQLVRSISQLAANLGLDAIAEGIERPDQEACLIGSGWRWGQGFRYSPPVEAAAATAMLLRT